MQKIDFEKFDLVLLPGKCLPAGPYSDLYEEIFVTWKDMWIEVFTEVGSPQAWNADAFFRSDLIPTVLYDGKLVGFYIATMYPLQGSFIENHSYFSIFPESAVEKLRDEGVRNVASYEFMSVLPEWRKSELGFSFGAVLVELGLKVRDALDCDASVGVARIQKKIDQIAHACGAFTLEKEARRGNLVCEIVGFLKKYDRHYPDSVVHDLCVQLWERRTLVNKYGFAINEGRTKNAA